MNFFCGHFEHIFGTNVLFEIKHKIDVKTEDNQNNSNNKLVQYLANSQKTGYENTFSLIKNY